MRRKAEKIPEDWVKCSECQHFYGFVRCRVTTKKGKNVCLECFTVKYEEEENTQFARVSLGAEYKIQTNWKPLWDRRISWHFRGILRSYINDVDFPPPPGREEIYNTIELGVSFGIDKPINILGYNFVQGGVGYEWSESLKALRFFTTFPF